ncbi:MAG: hypothetical protein ABIE03_02590 [Patescibacteria group bacterium]|nr:hypothetical protein [Patescibacteria group bacterium]
MKKFLFFIGFTAVAVIIGGSVTALILYNRSKNDNFSENSQNVDDSADNTTTFSKTEDDNVSDPTAEDVIRLFFALIDEDRPNEAVLMMSDNLVGTDPIQSNSKIQAYAVTFDEWESVQTLSVEEYDKENWTIHARIYKVKISIIFIDNPEYNLNWDEGENTRRVRLLRVEDKWQIDGIATGP